MHKAIVVQFEISGADSRQLSTFYSKLFGWDMLESPTPGCYLVSADGIGLAGAIGPRRPGVGSVTLYVEVDDLQEHLSVAEELGGSMVGGARAIRNDGPFSYAFVVDPAGNVVGLSTGLEQALQQFPRASRLHRSNGAVRSAPAVQFEITGDRSADLQRFYGILFGWQMQQTGAIGYARVLEQQAGVAGAVGKNWLGRSAQVTVYVEVPDLQRTLARARELGARIHERNAADPGVPRTLQSALISDPDANIVGVSQSARAGAQGLSLAHQLES